MKLPQISEAEYQVMKVIWKNEPISTNKVIEILTESTIWKPKTIQSMLFRLVKKEALTYEKDGKIFVYSAKVKEEEYLSHESKSFLNRFYDGTLSTMVLNFLKHDQLSKEDINKLRKILDERQKKGSD